MPNAPRISSARLSVALASSTFKFATSLLRQVSGVAKRAFADRRRLAVPGVLSLELPDRVADADGAAADDASVDAAQAERCAFRRVEEDARLGAKPGGELLAAEVRLLAE